ncbi:MAG TPA: alpha/beta hydrolase [Candidatus Aquilonibacter sp.]|nr:alpha/beta hydrolase [Candidatus Aquilonibacter sp.]
MRIKALAIVLSLQLAGGAFACAQQVLPLWPHGTPEPPQTTQPETNMADQEGHLTNRLTNITQPSMTVFLPSNSGTPTAAAVVFPGGGYLRLAWDKEGLDVCHWLNAIDMACLLVKYRVPEDGHYPENKADFEDAQQAMRLAREHAAEWNINPARVGVIGFSAGGHLAAVLSNHFDDNSVESTPAAAEVDPKINARPEFAILGYPAYLSTGPNGTELDPALTPNSRTPPTFLIQAENDQKYIDSSLVYYRALKDADVPAELHLYATGGHGFGVHPVGYPEEHWTHTATEWLERIGMLPARRRNMALNPNGPPTPQPCPSHQLAIGRPAAQPNAPAGPPDNPNCL